MVDKATDLQIALTKLKIDATVEKGYNNPPYYKFWVRLGPKCTIEKLENKKRELGLELKSFAPICSPDFPTGTVCLEFMDGPHPLVEFDKLAVSSGFSSPDIFNKFEIPVLLGVHDVVNPLIIDLTTLPHLLIAGTTGSGKSVCEHACIQSITMHAKSNRVRLVLCDPKLVEFSKYQKSRTLLRPVATSVKDIESALSFLLDEMEFRLTVLKARRYRDFKEYRGKTGKGSYIVVVIDELNDLMMTSSKAEHQICRLAQMGRAAGIYLIVATQYPHTKVVTGTIKANLGGRICFRTTDPAHSRVMLGDQHSFATLLEGKGDGYLSGGNHILQRFRGALVDFEDERSGVSDSIMQLIRRMFWK